MRNNKTENSMRSIWATVVGILLLLCVAIYLLHSYLFYRSHFSNHVVVDGVNVSRLTDTEALDKLSERGTNVVVLQNNKVQQKHQGGQISPISKSKLHSYFKRQYKAFGSKKHWRFADDSITAKKSALKELSHETVSYEIAGHAYQLKPNDVASQIYYYDNDYHFEGTDKCQQLINDVNQHYGTLHKSYDFTTPDNQKIKITNQSYGWQVDGQKTQNALLAAFKLGDQTVNGDKYLQGEGYNTFGTGYTNVNNGLGTNYVVISLKQQKLWVYKDNKPVVTLNNVVTGTVDKAKDDATPAGVWYIMYKQSPSVLKGKNDDGSPYSSKVQYWMPFTLSGCGIHDASWRTDWSSQAYLEGGSHGCVNVKPAEIKSVWDNVDQNEPVVIYAD